MKLPTIVILCITSLLLLIPISGATYDVVSGIASNSTEYTTSASYGELHNLSLATGTGTVFIKASWDARVNFTAPLYGRFVRDGVSLGRFNLTQSVYAQVGSYELALNETTGTHYYGFEVYSNKRGTIYSRNFSAVFLKNGTYGTGAGGGNVSSVTGAPAGVLDCTGTDEITCTISPTGTNFRNDTISTQGTAITTLQNNDTADRAYVNTTFLPILTYAGNFPNTTIAGYNGNYPNSSLLNYLLISTYAGNFPNNSLSNYLLTSLFATNFNTSFHTEIPVCNNVTGKLVSDDGETITCGTDQTGAAGGNVSSVTAQSPLTYTGTTDVVIKDERTTYPNTTISDNLINWNATYNSTYAALLINAPNATVAANLANWNATYNSTYDAKEPAISQGISPQFWMFNKTWQNITTTWITEGVNQWFTDARAISAVQSILDMMNTSSATNNTNSQARDDLINSTKVNKTDAGELSGGTLAYSIFPVNITTGTGGISFANGTNNISVGSSKKMRQVTAGIITALYVNQTDDVACSGNVTVTSSGAYKSHIAWSSAANASSTGLSATFTAGEWLLYNMTENTGCTDFTFVQAHTKTS